MVTAITALMYLALMCRSGMAFTGVGFKGRKLWSTALNTGTSLMTGEKHASYIKDIAFKEPPVRLDLLLTALQENGEELVNPRDRGHLNPFLIPLTRNRIDNSLLCYIRWPTQKESMDLQLVRTTDAGVRLVSLSTDNMIKRIAAEMDFYSHPKATTIIDLVNADGEIYKPGDYIALLKSGKFPALTDYDLKLILDRYILTKVGAFPDCYERLATDYMQRGDQTSALITCERATSVFYSWGHPLAFHAGMMASIAGRELEVKDVARAALAQPLWTVAKTIKELDDVAKYAGFTGSKILGEMHAFRAKDKRENDIGEGLSPVQVTLDQAAHLMDAIAMGVEAGGWLEGRKLIAQKYEEGGYPEVARFISDYEVVRK